MARWGAGVWGSSYWSAVVGSMAATETGVDTFAAEGDVIVSGYMSATESTTDTFASAGAVIDTGVMAAVETGQDVFAATGVNVNNGTMAAVETGQDVFAATGVNIDAGYMAATETGVDVFAATGTVTVTGYMAAVETGDDVLQATGTVTPTPAPPPPILADIGPGDEYRKKAQKKRDEEFAREKAERDRLRDMIKQAIDPVVEQAQPVVVARGRRSVQVLSVDGGAIGIPVPPEFNAAEVAAMVAQALENAQIAAQRVQRKAEAERALAAARIEIARIMKRRRDDEFLMLMD